MTTPTPTRRHARADLTPTLAQAMTVPEVRELVEAVRPFYAAVFDDNGDVTVSTGHITTRDWIRLKTAFNAIKGYTNMSKWTADNVASAVARLVRVLENKGLLTSEEVQHVLDLHEHKKGETK